MDAVQAVSVAARGLHCRGSRIDSAWRPGVARPCAYAIRLHPHPTIARPVAHHT
ncbi:hypothetical protein BSIN_1653 [Burkholderia singularis]|uniref:Uncharacterized protein n=1 Tax=Burkholderia singularis TaxID=1503053 RepID=A0A238GZF4_9BURK|nr:hypothetical protein BSIN_1653 [Burkholderia singularis]